MSESSYPPGAIPLRVRNIAPHEGDREVGMIPFGLSAIVAENEEGKSRILSAITAIPLDTKKPEDLITVNRGNTDAGVGLGTAEIQLQLVPVGQKVKTRTTRQTPGAEGPIHELPDPVQMLITGGDNVSETANWRNRMKALSAFVAFEATEERLQVLAGLLQAPDDDIAAELLERHSASPFEDLLAAADALADGRSGILHKRKRDAQAEAAALAADLGRQDGRLEEILRRASKESGIGVADPELRRILLDEGAAAEPERLRLLEAALSALKLRVGERLRTATERAALAAEQGERPSVDADLAKVDLCRRAVEEAERGAGAAAERAAAARARRAELAPQIGDAIDTILELSGAWERAAGVLDVALTPTLHGEWPGSAAADRAADVVTAAEKLRAALAACDEVRVLQAEVEAAVEGESRASDLATADLAAARGRLAEAEEGLSAARGRQAAWDRTAAQLQAPLPPLFPTPGDAEPWNEISVPPGPARNHSVEGDGPLLLAATAKVEALRPRALAAASGEVFRLAEAERQRLQDAQQGAMDRAERLEAEAVATWDRLSDIISGLLQSDFLRVGPRRMEVRLDSGRWVDVADDIELSKGRLRRAMLDFYLERVEPGERNVVIDDSVMLPIGQEGREELSRRAAAKSIRLMFEQPRLGTDPREVHVIFYGGAVPQEVGS